MPSRRLLPLAACACLCLMASTPAAASTLTFDNIPLNGSGLPDLTINGGYGGLSWNGSWNIVESQGALTGGLPVGLSVTHPVESAPGSCCVLKLFDFYGADFGPYLGGQNPLNVAGSVIMHGWANGELIYAMQAPLAASGLTHVEANWVGIDALEVQPAPATAFSTGYPFFLMDNFEYSLRDGSSAPTPTPEPGSLLLIASGAVAMMGRRRSLKRRRG